MFDLKPFPYQQEAIDWIITKFNDEGQKCILLADEPGVGKTPPAIISADFLKCPYVVIITAAIGRGTFQWEYNRWLKNPLPSQAITSGKQNLDKKTRCLIISYQLAVQLPWRTIILKLLNNPYSLLIVDEAHAVKSKPKRVRTNGTSKVQGKTTKVVLDMFSPAAHKTLFMTGTPVANSIMELWTIFNTCLPNTYTYQEFGNTFSNSQYNPWSSLPDFVGYKKENLPLLKSLLKKFMLRRFVKDVQKHLPPKRINRIYFDAVHVKTPIELKIRPEDTLDNNPNWSSARAQLGIDKLPFIKEWIKDFLEQRPGCKLLIGCYHIKVVEELVKFLKGLNITIGTITGKDSSTKKDNTMQMFQSDSIQVIVANIKACSTCITLTRCQNIAIAELECNPSVLKQFIKRVHREGQTGCVDIHYLLAKKSFDDDIIETLLERLDLLKELDRDEEE